MTALTFPSVRANTLTAEPLLKLLIAVEGEEPSTPSPMVAWKVYQEFLRYPASGEDDASFQTEWIDGDSPVFHVTFTRQFTDEVAGVGSLTHQVAIQFGYEVERPADAESIELWRSDHPDLEAYLAAIEAHPAYIYCREHGTLDRFVFQVELDTFTEDA